MPADASIVDSASARSARRGLLVVGMHRSGTSAITRVLGLCGARLPSHLMPASGSNPLGYYESQRIYDLHEELLGELGTAWDDLTTLPADWLDSPTGAHWVDRMARAVEAEYGDSPFLTLKDPRLCRLVPLWLRVLSRLGYVPSFVLPVRNPLDVAASLREAEGTDEAKGRLLWLQYFLAAERDTRGHLRSFFAYDDLLRDWRAVIERIGKDVDLAFPRLGARAEAEIDGFLARDLRHHAASAEELAARRDVPQWIKDAFAWALAAAAGHGPDPEVLDRIALEMRPAEEGFGPVVAQLELGRRAARDEAQRQTARADGLEAQLERARDERTAAHRELADARREIAALAEQLERRDAHAGQLLEWTKSLVAWAAGVVHPGDATRAHLDAVLRAMDGADAGAAPKLGATAIRLAQQAAELARVAEQAETRKARLQQVEAELEQLRAAHEQTAAALARLGDERGREVEHAQQQIRGLWQQIAARDGELGRLKSELVHRAAAVAHQTAQLESLRLELAEREERLAALEGQALGERAAVAERDAWIAELEARLARVESSWAWRLLHPFGRRADGGR